MQYIDCSVNQQIVPRAAGVSGAVARVVGFGILVRVLLLFASALMLRVVEPNADFMYYKIMVAEPWILMTGTDADRMNTGGIYAPLIPLQMLFPGGLFIKLFGLSLGQRIGMAFYDVAATAISVYVAFALYGPPKSRSQWIFALLLTIIPGAIGASVIWGQEDTIWALWSAIVVFTAWRFGPSVAAFVGGMGLFTSKLFAFLLVAALALGAKRRRKPVINASMYAIGAFFLFLLMRWWHSGFFMPKYRYDVISNATSIYALYELVIGPVSYEGVTPYVLGIALLSMLVLAAFTWHLQTNVIAALLAVHLVFALTFLGVQPEHHQSFIPMLIVMAWYLVTRNQTFAARTAVPFALLWSFSGLAYLYKMAYGLSDIGSVAANADAQKDHLRHWFAAHFFQITPAILVVLIFMTLGCGISVLVITLRNWEASAPPEMGVHPSVEGVA